MRRISNKIRKEYLDDLIRLERRNAERYDHDLHYAIRAVADSITSDLFGDNLVASMHIGEVVRACVGNGCIVKNCTNAQVYSVFEAMGFEVVE